MTSRKENAGLGHGNNVAALEEEEEDKDELVSKHNTSDLDGFTQEKPIFPNRVTLPSLCVPLELSITKGHKVPYTVNRYLRDYQREGIQFIYNNYMQSRGCILGDDMGLGKTVQVIGFLSAVLRKKGTWEDIENNKPQFLQSQMPSRKNKPNKVSAKSHPHNKQYSMFKSHHCCVLVSLKVFLIVAPLSVLYNWKDELDTWGHFQCMVVHGLKKEEDLARIKNGRVEIALTTYETLRICLDQFNNIPWSAVFVDEAHKIKNPNSQITQGMKDLKCQIRIGLTGTILQNNLEELWCVMDWAVPGCLGSLGHFKNTFSDPIEQGQRHSATKRVLATGRKAVRSLVKKISHYFLRRTKALIKEQLPKKDDRVVYCSLTDFQQTVYRTVLDSEDVTLLLRSSEKCGCQSGHTRRSCCYKTNSEGVKISELYFSYLAILRKISNHVALLQSTTGTSKKQEKYVGAICQKVFKQFPDFVQRCKNEAFEALSDPMYSGKMKVLEKLIQYHLKNKDKVLLFSLSTKLLDVLESYCMAEGLEYSRLDGNTKSKERIQIVKEFNCSPHVNLCLVSTMAGGLGLNFVGANVVVLFDPTWNPANDLQAIDRAYRIGQCRDVTVFRLISLGTVEEVIYLRQVYKQQLQSSVMGKESSRRYFEAVQGDGVRKGELFGIKNLFRLQIQGTCLTRKILEREGQVEAGVMTTRLHAGEEKEKEELTESSSTTATTSHGQPVKGNQEEVEVLLDFSSGSDEDEDILLFKKTSLTKNADPSRSDSSGAGRSNLLQYGFSKLLQRVKAQPDLENGDSSSGEDGELDKKSSTGCSRSGSCNLTGSDATERRDDKVRTSMEVRPHVGGDMVTSGEDQNQNKLQDVVHKPQQFPYNQLVMKNSLGDSVKKRVEGINRKRQSSNDRARSKFTELIEEFSSSEDEHLVLKKAKYRRDEKKVTMQKSSDRRTRTSKGVSFTSEAHETSSKNGHIDSVLGGVQEVAYTHSNQGVVGGSKAEELISRAAVRDVFERRMFSQLPANLLLGTQESLPSSPESNEPCQDCPVRPTQLCIEHPVSFSNKHVVHSRHTTFIIGETPLGVRRQQLEQMALKLNFSSVDQFAKEVLRGTSAQRLAWLRQYYSSLDQPHLADVLAQHFSDPVDPAKASSSSTMEASPSTSLANVAADSSKPQRRKYRKKCGENPQTSRGLDKKTLEETSRDMQDVAPELKKAPLHLQKEARDTGRVFGLVQLETIRESGGDSGVMNDDPSVLDPVKDTNLAAPTVTATEKAHSSSQSNLEDLLGDTSILDDLFKPKSRGAHQNSSPRTSFTSITKRVPAKSPPRTSDHADTGPLRSAARRNNRKDFWDVLDDEESINKLTDSAVQRACMKKNFSVRQRPKEEENTSLWKTNEKFLWKKRDGAEPF
ncbi:DNA excision repair protein ERCC-6-like 2 isoform X2 [Synchiropus splendidus]|uniref:DNA excision repair protein ERCC-6-like 2 isoform X2 n=1 Tax=Synchiropus splendidus TaxID=270530 RepID=UPI00237DCC0E|nr:DNA excision repair protein ERCC-6-like 2 isoform X2 [Synchiropus splendidus]